MDTSKIERKYMIKKEETVYLKAIAIISVILCHFWGWIYEPAPILKLIGDSAAQSGVFLFLFLSGYGVMQSYDKKGLKNFWNRRILKIYVPFLLVSLTELVLEIWNYRDNIYDMYIRSTFLSALGLYPNNLLDSTFWFIPFILLQYLAFYLSFRLQAGRNMQNAVYIVLVLVLYCIFKRYFTWVRDNDIYGFGFWLGSMVSQRNPDRVKLEKSKLKLSVGIICTVGYISTLIWFDNAGLRFINCICLSSLEILGTLVISASGMALKWLKWIGTHSYELYLTEGFFFWHKILYDIAGYHYLGLALHFGVIMMLSFFIQVISENIRGLIHEVCNNFFKHGEQKSE